MHFSTRSEYGLLALVYLARHYKSDVTSLAVVAKETKISLAYLERLFAKLKAAGIVIATKGKSGGYRLVKNPRAIKVKQIINTLEGSIMPYHCLGSGVSCRQRGCGVQQVWLKVAGKIDEALSGLTLADLIK